MNCRVETDLQHDSHTKTAVMKLESTLLSWPVDDRTPTNDFKTNMQMKQKKLDWRDISLQQEIRCYVWKMKSKLKYFRYFRQMNLPDLVCLKALGSPLEFKVTLEEFKQSCVKCLYDLLAAQRSFRIKGVSRTKFYSNLILNICDLKHLFMGNTSLWRPSGLRSKSRREAFYEEASLRGTQQSRTDTSRQEQTPSLTSL